jgi:hypothetical protein
MSIDRLSTTASLIAALRRDLAEVLKDVPAGDAEALDAARPRVIRTILLWEFGSELREHSQWQPMLDSLVQTLQTDESHRQAMSRLLSELRV